ncbi:P43 5S RNA-binding protein-like [Brienomyrus brachyistius]|uniref:P43 5S RNA-binding protein-like n=1 Tax=Brienomyrus brachyistius TaxID=42636 RepID=UPI0020B1F50C|nr:P43 5S RNA-binding protein-like [Brienomyrus brachyistius]
MVKMNGLNGKKVDAIPRLKRFVCGHEGCAAAFSKEWRFKEHESVHTGERPLRCPTPGCERSFSRKKHLIRHKRGHTGEKPFRCTYANCEKRFLRARSLQRHAQYNHGNKDTNFKCHYPACTLMFRKRKDYKMHLNVHGVTPVFKCTVKDCGATFETRVSRRAHEKKHSGYACPDPGCQVVEYTWVKMVKHRRQHPATYACKQCQAAFGSRNALRRHKRCHALQKPTLQCPRLGCRAQFSTAFNLQHHIRKVHLQLLRYRCSHPGCQRAFAMRESLNRHQAHHDPYASRLKQKQRQRASKSWQKRLVSCGQRPLVEDDLSQLFTMRMRLPRRLTMEANLSKLFSERKIPRPVEQEVNLRDFFSLKPVSPPTG